jgi:CDP-4-dehydro-6-deoxyglucose reductase, E1
MAKFKYKLADDTWDQLEIEAINEVISSNRYTMGSKVSEFENEFAKFVGTKYAVMSNSGSSANLLAIAALVYANKLHKGDEVIVPAVSWSTTYYPVSQYGLKLVFVDIDIDTLNISYEKIKEAISPKTRAIFAVNLLGNPNNFYSLSKLCKDYSLLLIEDNCESLGATFEGKQAGTFGILGTFSSFYSHHISTMEGGITVTNDKNLYDLMLSLRAHGWTRNLDANNTLYTKNDDDFYESFNFILPGYNLRPLEFEGAIGLVQIKKISKIIKQRKENAQNFREIASKFDNLKIQTEIGESSWFGFSILLMNELEGRRDQVIELLRNNGVEVRPIVAGNFTKNPVISHLDHRVSGELKNADYIHDNGFFVGNHSKSNKKELLLLEDLLREFLNEH